MRAIGVLACNGHAQFFVDLYGVRALFVHIIFQIQDFGRQLRQKMPEGVVDPYQEASK